MEIPQGWIIAIAIILAIFILIYIFNLRETIKEKDKKMSDFLKIITDKEGNIKDFQNLNAQQRLEFEKARAEIKLNSQNWAMAEFEKFKTNELAAIKKAMEETTLAAAANLLEQWKREYESKIRKDAANRSYSVVLGKVTEHLLPFHQNFPFNPQEARFIGTPIDLIVFDGLGEDDRDIDIYFVEIKTGKSRFSDKQKRIKDAVDSRRIIWYPIKAEDM